MIHVLLDLDEPTESARTVGAWDWPNLLDTPNLTGVSVFDSLEELRAEVVKDAVAQIKGLIAATKRDDLYWIAVHAIRKGLYELPAERRAEFDPLGMLWQPHGSSMALSSVAEEIARHLTDDELQAAHDAGVDDYWETVDGEVSESFASSEGLVAGLEHALTLLEGKAVYLTEEET